MKRWTSLFLTIVLLTGLNLSVAGSTHDLPEVYFVNISHGGIYEKSDLSDVSIYAEAADGYSISGVKVFIDFLLAETLTDAPYTFDLSGISAGIHYLSVNAVDNDGYTATEKIRISVEGEQSLKTVYENDLSDYVSDGSNPVGSGSFGPEKRGSATISSVTNADKYGDEHGVVAEIISKGESATDGDNAYFQISPGTSASLYVEEFDIFIKEIPTNFQFSVRDTNSSTLNSDVTLKADSISFTNASKDNKNYKFEENPGWYHCVYQVNTAKGTYSFSITKDGEDIPLASTADSKQRYSLTDIQGFRFFMKVTNAETTDAAFDNFKISVGVAESLISDIGYGTETGCDKIPPAESAVKVYTNNALNMATVNADTVQIYRGDTNVVIDSVSYDKGVVIKLKEKLRPSTDYRVVLSEEIIDTSGNMLGTALTSSFVTDYANQDVSNLSVNSDSDGSYITGNIINLEDSGQTMYTVLTVWNGDRLTDMTVKAITWENGAAFRTESVTVNDGETMEFAIWDSFTYPKVLPKEIVMH